MNKNKDKEIEKIGGMALFNGILLRNSKKECLVEDINGKINIDITNLKESKKSLIFKIPVIRGIYGILETLLSGVSYIMSSVKETCKNILSEEDAQDIKITRFEVYIGFAIAFFVILFFFTALPNYLSNFVDSNLQKNIVQMLTQIISFAMYLIILKNNKSLQSIFEYHGAEHKVVNAYEKLSIEEITVENVKNNSRFHKRCGGNFVVYLFILVLLTTIIIPSNDLYLKTIMQVVIFPLLIGISYEILNITSKLNGTFEILSYPAMLIQFVTTKEPSEDKIQLAIYALLGCVRENDTINLKEYINEYVKNNLENIEYETNDILRVVAKVKKLSKEEIYLNLNTLSLNFQEQIYLDTLLNKMYKDNIPLQYILGKQSFYNEVYEVNESVLIPRADTEILVEKAIEYINKENLETIIDMCTGSGCVGISIAKNSNIKFGFLVDISQKALEVANKNNILNGTSNKLGILKSNLFDEFKNLQENKYDIIVSNPPYIKTSVIETLEKQVQNEPHLALDGGKDGLQVYKKIFIQAKEVLKDNGYLMLEIGYDQLDKITKIIEKDKNYELIESVKDLNGNDRVVVCRFLQ